VEVEQVAPPETERVVLDEDEDVDPLVVQQLLEQVRELDKRIAALQPGVIEDLPPVQECSLQALAARVTALSQKLEETDGGMEPVDDEWEGGADLTAIGAMCAICGGIATRLCDECGKMLCRVCEPSSRHQQMHEDMD
jgi:hypothetical protein